MAKKQNLKKCSMGEAERKPPHLQKKWWVYASLHPATVCKKFRVKNKKQLNTRHIFFN